MAQHIMTSPFKSPLMHDWYLFMRELEEFRERTGWGLANVWALVEDQRYDEATRLFDEVKRMRP